MANEITVSAALSLAKGSIKGSAIKSGLKRTITGDDFLRTTQIVGMAAEPLAAGDVSALGYLHLENLSETATVHIRSGAAGENLVRVLPGDVALFRLATAGDPHLIATAADTRVQFLLLEE